MKKNKELELKNFQTLAFGQSKKKKKIEKKKELEKKNFQTRALGQSKKKKKTCPASNRLPSI